MLKTKMKLAAALVLFWAPAVIFLAIAGEVLRRRPLQADVTLLNRIHAYASPVLDRLFLFFTLLGSAAVMLPITILAAGYLWYRRRRFDGLLILFGVGGAAAANFVLKMMFHRQRPALWHQIISETDYSFPSGHAMISSALTLCILAVLWRTRFRWPAAILGGIFIIMVGLSRLYLGVHYPTDVVAGWCASLAWVSLVIWIIGRRPGLPRRQSHPENTHHD
jgi:membrane-associated phospholipid phosphatase